MADTEVCFCDTSAALARVLSETLPRPTAIVGVGVPLCGDDGFGPAVAVGLPASAALATFDVQGVPESFLGPIVASGCPGVLFVDAADLGAEPGRVAVVPPARLGEIDVSTHVVSLGLAAAAISELAEAADGRQVVCALLAAQPQGLKEIDRMSPAMHRAVRLCCEGITAFAGAPGGDRLGTAGGRL